MKKLHVGLIIAIFALSSFMAINLYASQSLPGFSSGADCNLCHNSPQFVKKVDASISVGKFDAYKTFDTHRQYSRNYLPVIKTDNRSYEFNVNGSFDQEVLNVEFLQLTTIKNTTHIMVMARWSDSTIGSTTTKATSDKLGIIWNIDSGNFSVGNFLSDTTTSYPGVVENGEMALENGKADFWYVDTSVNGINKTSKAADKSISTSIATDASQDVDAGVWRFGGRYYVYLVRALTNSDTNDVQFTDGKVIKIATALWDNDVNTAHFSSFDNMAIVAEYKVDLNIGGAASGTTSSFTVMFVLAGLLIAVPVISKYKGKKD